MRPSLNLLALAAAAGAIALGGCGDDHEIGAASAKPTGSDPQARLAEQRVADFLSAMAAKDDAGACAMMTPELRRAITTALRTNSATGSCRTRAADILSPAKAPGNPGAKVASIELGRGTASAIVTATPRDDLATGPVESEVVLERRGGKWLISNF